MKKLLLMSTFIGIQVLFAQSPTFNSVSMFEKSGSEASGSGIAYDGLGNVYVAGDFSATCDFDPGPGIYNLSAVGGAYQAFVCKLDTAGNFIWAKQMGFSFSGTYTMKWNVALDGVGNVYISGNFTGTADFDPGAGTFNMTSVGGQNSFLVKLDNNGNFIWAKQLTGGTSNNSLCVDNFNNIYLAGNFSDTVDFDPGVDTSNLIPVGVSDAYIVKLDNNGDLLWKHGFGSTSNDVGFGVTTDNAGDVYFTGYFYYTIDFNPGVGTNNLISAGLADVFICKFDQAGNFIAAKNVGGGSSDFGEAVVVDDVGNIFINGEFNSMADFDPGAGIFNLTSSGATDVFLLKLDPTFNFLWAINQVPSTGNTIVQDMVIDESGDVYSTGFLLGAADFDPGPDTLNLDGGYYSGIYLSKIDGDGNLVWAGTIPGTSSAFNYGRGITLDNTTGNVYATGNFMYAADFDMGADTINHTCPGSASAYVLRLNQTINGLGINTPSDLSDRVILYPNPTDGATNIDLGKVYDDIDVVVKNISGQILMTPKFHSTDNISILINEATGMYLVEIYTDKGLLVNLKILKN